MAYIQTHRPAVHGILMNVKAFFSGLIASAIEASEKRAAILTAEIDQLKALDDKELAARGMRRSDIEMHVMRHAGIL